MFAVRLARFERPSAQNPVLAETLRWISWCPARVRVTGHQRGVPGCLYLRDADGPGDAVSDDGSGSCIGSALVLVHEVAIVHPKGDSAMDWAGQ